MASNEEAHNGTPLRGSPHVVDPSPLNTPQVLPHQFQQRTPTLNNFTTPSPYARVADFGVIQGQVYQRAQAPHNAYLQNLVDFSMPPPVATSTPIPQSSRLSRAAAESSPSSSIIVVPGGSGSQEGSVRSVRRPPQTPPSNFNIQPPDMSSDSGSSDDSNDDENIFPPGFGDVGGLRDLTRRRWQLDENISEWAGFRNAIGANSEQSSETILGANGSVHSAVIRRRRQLLEGRADDGPKDVVLSILWAQSRFAAAYYDLETGQLFLLPDVTDSAPDFSVLRSVYRQVNPTFLLVNKNADDRFLKVVLEITGYEMMAAPSGQDDTDDTDDPRPCSPVLNTQNTAIQLYQIPSRDYIPDSCKQRVQALQLPFEPPNLDPADHLKFITSLIPFSHEVMVRAMGCLLKFLDKSAIELFQLELVRGYIQVTDVVLFKLDELVLVDHSAWCSLQIFSTDVHPSSFKQGNTSSSKEGLSVFSILNRCVTVQGAKSLRLMLLRPTRNPEILTRRYDVIDYCMNTANFEFVTSITENLKAVKSVPKLLYRLSLLHATVTEWKQLYQTLYHCLLIGELCHCLEPTPQLLAEVGCSEYLALLRTLTQEMVRIIDFEQSGSLNRIVAKEGLDPELDKKKKQYACLPEIMSIVASEEMSELPTYVSQCCAVYIPEVGYLLAVGLWRENLTEEEVKIDHLEFRFKTHELAYYKSPRMRELDVVLGDCAVSILEKETIMMVRLTELILQNSSSLQRISDLIAELDSLIAISAISKSNNFVRPVAVSTDEKLQIVNGRHPISDMLCEFVPNSTLFNGHEKMVVLTGPNASGKSVYLKQVGIIVLMALSGSFVPATFAQIPLYDKVCTRVHAVESVSTGFSSFMVDINQMSLAIRSSSKSTLVIIDEFGKGTLEADGLALLTTSMQEFIDRGEDCPTIFLSTHFSSMIRYLKNSPLVKYQSMKFFDDNGTLTYLYELMDGNCDTSFAANLAKSQGIPLNVVERAIEMEDLTKGQNPGPIRVPKSENQIQIEAGMIGIADEFLEMNFNEVDPIAYLRSVKRKMKLLHKKPEEETEPNDNNPEPNDNNPEPKA